jgi:5'-methylthioadenosine phosphorylase
MADGTGLRPRVGVIGGTGFYEFAEDVVEVAVGTPYGEPSSPVAMGSVGGCAVAFLPRHGVRHELAPHTINYRANLWALRTVGVRRVIAPCAVGSLRADLGPGTVVVPDQVVDRTKHREDTYARGGALHVSFADPYCPDLRKRLLDGADTGVSLVDGGTMVVVEGPRFSTRAESRVHAAQGCDVVNMTGMPEAVLARELALCYAHVCLVTDHDAGAGPEGGVTQSDVFEVFAANIERLRELLRVTVPAVDADGSCSCGHALDGIDVPFTLP